MLVSKQIISLQNDNGTSYEMYIKVQNELVGAYNELRNELAQQKFGTTYDELVQQSGSSDAVKEKMKAIKKVYPQRISEAEPKKVGGTEQCLNLEKKEKNLSQQQILLPCQILYLCCFSFLGLLLQ
eukprot:TRINITY_DN29177_c0_g1_i1.p1 TRINITY_DN29177_c0_g1~~TRINITY_DN29177_c0_g1_i1.p1  ORF type:complete len:126 (+),score=11.16 TRINITY_DN29177_c0_g1_i1:1-378(+)